MQLATCQFLSPFVTGSQTYPHTTVTLENINKHKLMPGPPRDFALTGNTAWALDVLKPSQVILIGSKV